MHYASLPSKGYGAGVELSMHQDNGVKQRNEKQHQNSITEAFSRNNARQGQPFTQAFTQCVK